MRPAATQLRGEVRRVPHEPPLPPAAQAVPRGPAHSAGRPGKARGLPGPASARGTAPAGQRGGARGTAHDASYDEGGSRMP
eukprot:13415928-Alexandrium_andersonii.AAC.1